jgi:hypothetical protein
LGTKGRTDTKGRAAAVQKASAAVAPKAQEEEKGRELKEEALVMSQQLTLMVKQKEFVALECEAELTYSHLLPYRYEL